MNLPQALGLAETWPGTLGDSLVALVDQSLSDVKSALHGSGMAEQDIERVLAVRDEGVRVNNYARTEVRPLNSPDIVAELLRQGHMASPRGRWIIYPLTRDARRVIVGDAAGDGRVSYDHKVVRAFPYASELPRYPRGGGVLVVYGGPASIFDEPDVAHRLELLLHEADVVDVVSHDRNVTPSVTASVRAAAVCGGCGADDCWHSLVPDRVAVDPEQFA